MSYTNWLLFFSSLPTHPVGNRVKVWRKLVKSGAMQIKGSAYILPWSEAHLEFFQWLVEEIRGMGGDAAFARVERIDAMADPEIIALFRQRKEGDCKAIADQLDAAERRLTGLQPGATPATVRKLAVQLAKIRKNFDETKATDFFAAPSVAAMEARLSQALAALQALRGIGTKSGPAAELPRRSVAAYRGKRWLTRASPFVDRMASAWLIRTFIDPAAEFGFLDEAEMPAPVANAVVFDVTGGEFTHVGDLCTFEVIARSFSLLSNNPALVHVAGIVHDLDLKDDRYHPAEAAGVEEILSGIARLARDDADALERGIAVFAMLYAAKSR
jgi:hypothetical protein